MNGCELVSISDFYTRLLIIIVFNADVNECKVANMCNHYGTCINTNGSYVCDCTDGWHGQHCEDGKYC